MGLTPSPYRFSPVCKSHIMSTFQSSDVSSGLDTCYEDEYSATVASNDGKNSVSGNNVLFHVTSVRSRQLRDALNDVGGDDDHDGHVTEVELLHVLDAYASSQRSVKKLWKGLVVAGVVLLVLLACVFGLTVAAVYLAKDTNVAGKDDAKSTSIMVTQGTSDDVAADSSTVVRTGSVVDVIADGSNHERISGSTTSARHASVVKVRAAFHASTGVDERNVDLLPPETIAVCESHVGTSTAFSNMTYVADAVRVPTDQDRLLINAWAALGSVTAIVPDLLTGSDVNHKITPQCQEVAPALPGMTILDGTVGPDTRRICCPDISNVNEVCVFAKAVPATGEARPSSLIPHFERHRSVSECQAAVAHLGDAVECHSHPAGIDSKGPFHVVRHLPAMTSRHEDNDYCRIAQGSEVTCDNGNIPDTEFNCGSNYCDCTKNCYFTDASTKQEHGYYCQKAGNNERCRVSISHTCFPGDALVMLSSGATKRMEDVTFGDELFSIGANGEAQYSPFLGWSKNMPTITYSAVRLTTSTGANLRASSTHFVHFARAANPSVWLTGPMIQVAVGDSLRLASGAIDTVVAIDDVPVVGAYVPMTSSTSVVVDGVAASMWTASTSTFFHALFAASRFLGMDELSCRTLAFNLFVRLPHALLPAPIWRWLLQPIAGESLIAHVSKLASTSLLSAY